MPYDHLRSSLGAYLVKEELRSRRGWWSALLQSSEVQCANWAMSLFPSCLSCPLSLYVNVSILSAWKLLHSARCRPGMENLWETECLNCSPKPICLLQSANNAIRKKNNSYTWLACWQRDLCVHCCMRAVCSPPLAKAKVRNSALHIRDYFSPVFKCFPSGFFFTSFGNQSLERKPLSWLWYSCFPLRWRCLHVVQPNFIEC